MDFEFINLSCGEKGRQQQERQRRYDDRQSNNFFFQVSSFSLYVVVAEELKKLKDLCKFLPKSCHARLSHTTEKTIRRNLRKSFKNLL
jgi:hypothetical protein